jgi:hypothetical protein
MKFLCAAGMVGMRVTAVSSGVNAGLVCRSVAKTLPSMVKAPGLILGNTHTHARMENKFESMSTDPSFKGIIAKLHNQE